MVRKENTMSKYTLIQLVFQVAIDFDNELNPEIRKDMLGSGIRRALHEPSCDEVQCFKDIVTEDDLGDILPEVVEWRAAREWKDVVMTTRRVDPAVHAPHCPLCVRAEHASDFALSSTGFVERTDSDTGRQTRFYLDWNNLLFCGASSSWNYKGSRFIPFGQRNLPLLDVDLQPQHDLSQNRLLTASELVSEIRHAMSVSFGPNYPTRTVVGKIKTATANDGRVVRWKPVMIIPLSQYVGVAIGQPNSAVRRDRRAMRDFWDWRSHTSGTPDSVVAHTCHEWKGVCAYCLVHITREGSLSRALVNSGAPDPWLRISSEYFEDLLEAATYAERERKLTVLVVEPVTERMESNASMDLSRKHA